MIRMYLDQFAWIDLARAAHGRSGSSEGADDALAVIRHGVGRRLLSCPLSAVHYMETLVRTNAPSRHRLATVMAELSRFDTIAPPSAVLPRELDIALNTMVGKPSDPRPVEPFGWGVWFAFGSSAPAYELPVEVKEQLTAGRAAEFERVGRLFVEHEAIMGPPEGVPMPGMVENRYYADFGERYVLGEQQLAEAMQTHKLLRHLDDVIAATEVIDILPPLNKTLERTGALSDSEWRRLDSRAGLEELLHRLPSRSVAYELRKLRHQNRQTKWEPNDLEDLAALSIAIPYCDIVVTEQQWVHLARRARLDSKFGTAVVGNVRDAVPHIVAGV